MPNGAQSYLRGSIRTETPALVLGSGHHGALGVVRSLGRLGIPVFVVDNDPRTPSFASKYCRQSFVWDFKRNSPERSAEYVANLGRKLGVRPILIPVTDPELLFAAAHMDILRENFRFPEVRYDLLHALCSKREMHFLARRLGLPSVKACFPVSAEHLREFAKEAGFPLMLKPVEARRARNETGGEKAVARDMPQLLEKYALMENPDQRNLVVQEYIPGGEETNWMFNGYFDEGSNCLFGMTGHKLRQYRPYVGVTSLGVCRPNPAIMESTIRFVSAIGYRGILDVDYRYDARDGSYKMLDVNPRTGWTFRLFVADNGIDVARAMYLELTGQEVPAGEIQAGRKWMVEDMDFASALQQWREGKLTAGEWLHSVRGVQETAMFARDDLGPLFQVCKNDARSVLRKAGWDAVIGGFKRRLSAVALSLLCAPACTMALDVLPAAM